MTTPPLTDAEVAELRALLAGGPAVEALAIPATGWVPDVVPDTIVDPAWGNAVRDRTVSRFATVADRDANLTTPPKGTMAWVDALAVLGVVTGTGPRVWSTSNGIAGATVVGNAVTAISAAQAIAVVNLGLVPYPTVNLVALTLMIQNDTANAGSFQIRVERGSVIVKTWVDLALPAALNTGTGFGVTFVEALGANTTRSWQSVVARTTGTGTCRTFADATVNRIAAVSFPVGPL